MWLPNRGLTAEHVYIRLLRAAFCCRFGMTAAISSQSESAELAPLLAELDGCVRDRVLVFGSLPPAARDLDLLARPGEREALATQLGSLGFERKDDQWVRFRKAHTAVVDLAPVDAWHLPPEEVRALFGKALPLPGLNAFVRPAPAHALLILARKFVRARERSLNPKLRNRLESVAIEDPGVWEAAADRAGHWGAESALACLSAAYSDAAKISVFTQSRAVAEIMRASGRGPARAHFQAWASRFPRPRRSTLVTFSGLDGAGKSSQVGALERALHTVGCQVVPEWAPLGGTPSAMAIVAFGRPLLRRATGATEVDRSPRLGIGHLEGNVSSSTKRSQAVLRGVWVTTLVGLNAAAHLRAKLRHLGRGRTVIFDRYVLDSAVQLQHNYGDTRLVRLCMGLLKGLSPKATRGYFLDVRPETARGRKADLWSIDQLGRRAALYRDWHERFEVVRLDGERPPEVLAEEIARDVWRSLRKGG
jgi:thymidylate kinase